MKSEVKAQDDNTVEVTVTIDAADVDACINKTYKDFAHKYDFPGFRKGKAPRPVIDNAFGSEAVMATVEDTLVNDAYPQVIEQEQLYPVGSPTFDESDDAPLPKAGSDYVFTFKVAVKPEIELTSYDPVQIELPMSEATEAEIDEQITSMREHYASYEDAPDDAEITQDGFADIAVKATDAQGSSIETIESTSRLYNLGSGMFSEAFDNEIIGMKKGETKTFTLTIPLNEKSVLLSSQLGKKITFEVTCNGVKEKAMPELTDEWARDTMGFDSVDDLREQVKLSIEAQKSNVMPRLKENACTIELIKRVDTEIPASMAEEAESELLQDFFTQLQQQGMSFDAYLAEEGLTSDQFKTDVKRQALDEAKQQLALDAWARNKNIEVSDEDISAEFERAGVEDPAATEKEWRESGRLYLIREGIARSKAMADVVDTAVVTEVDFTAREENDTNDKSGETPDESHDDAGQDTKQDTGQDAGQDVEQDSDEAIIDENFEK